MQIDFNALADKWQKRWSEKRIYEPEIEKKRKPFYIQVAYPYPSGAMHIGHARTYTVTDIVARYKRLRGFNSLMPMGWHVSGTPVIASVELIRAGDPQTIKKIVENFRIPERDLKQLGTPEGFVDYFVNRAKTGYKAGFNALGLGIDWRRELTTMDKQYNKFIEWQYRKLYKKGYISKGKYPVRWCQKDRNAVGDHDLVEGEGTGIAEMTLLKFKLSDGRFLVAATLRPETVFGQTNLWIDAETDYAVAQIGKEKWIISSECAEKLDLQKKKAKITGMVKGAELIGKHAVAPGINRSIIILPASFCDPKIGTGIVTSVPSDAPADWIALRDLQQSKELCKRHGFDFSEISKIKPIPIIKTERLGELAAITVCEQLGIKSQSEHEKLEQAKKIVYREGFHLGTMGENCGKYAGMKVEKAKELVGKELIKKGQADVFYEMEGTATCRCGTRIVVALLEDQWFVKYGSQKWKREAKKTLSRMQTVPGLYRQQYEHVFDWLEDKPCTRSKGLGTKFPWDKTKIIEPLGDSTIYMAYFTISHIIKTIPAEKLNDAVFDYVLLGKGNAAAIAKKTKVPEERLREMRANFDYWYPLAFNTSAIELIPNHMSFSIFQHAAIFPPAKRQLGTLNLGMLVIEGQKMASSKGNVVLIEDISKRIGPDMVRFFLMNFNEPWQEVNWKQRDVEVGLRTVAAFTEWLVEAAKKGDIAGEISEKTLSSAEKWVLNRLNRRSNAFGEAMDAFELRKALQEVPFGLIRDLKWFERRASAATAKGAPYAGSSQKGEPEPSSQKAAVERKIAETCALLLAPFMPHLCEEVWEALGNSAKGFVAEAMLSGKAKVDEQLDAAESLVESVVADTLEIKKLIKMEKPKKIMLYVAPQWQWEALPALLSACSERPDFGTAMKAVMKHEKARSAGKAAEVFAKAVLKRLAEYRGAKRIDEFAALEGAKDFLARETGAEIIVQRADSAAYDPAGKAKNAMPLKPAIYVE